jgi:hypothetical protein
LRICQNTGIALMVPTRARAGMPTARRPVCRAGLAHRAPPACKRPQPCNAGLFFYWLTAWHRMSGFAAHVQQMPHVRCWRGTGCLLPQWEFSASAEIPACL